MARGTKSTPTQAPSSAPTEFYVANQHAGPIMFPRRGQGNVTLPPLVLQPGTVTRIPAEEWLFRRQNQVVQNYLDRGLLAEVQKPTRNAEVPTVSRTNPDLVIPEHLSTEEELEGSTGTAKAGVRKDRTRSGHINIG